MQGQTRRHIQSDPVEKVLLKLATPTHYKLYSVVEKMQRNEEF